jgi:polyphosphate kinase
MHRNLDRRVEVLVRLRSAHARVIASSIDLAFDPGTSTWHLLEDGNWERHDRDEDGRPLLDLQESFVAASRAPAT